MRCSADDGAVWSTATRSTPTLEIKPRGISAVDEAIKEGPIHVTMNEAPYQELSEAQQEAFLDGIRVRWRT
jgi:hypothetical protein